MLKWHGIIYIKCKIEILQYSGDSFFFGHNSMIEKRQIK